MPEDPTNAPTAIPPEGDELTDYDRAHFATYLKLLDADAMHVDWKLTARSILCLNPDADAETAHRIYQAHLMRARWMTRTGYRQLLK